MSRNSDLLRHRTASLATLSLAVVLLYVVPAFGATVTDRPLLFSFDGADTSAGQLVKPYKIAVDNSNGDVYVSEGREGPNWKLNEVISKFNADGTAANFSVTGKSSLFLSPGSNDPKVSEVSIAVDNSGGSGGPGEGEQGRLYVLIPRTVTALKAYAPSGALLWEIAEIGGQDIAVDQQGHIWLLVGNTVKEYDSGGNLIGSFAVSKDPHGLDVGANGNVYLAGFSGVDTYVGGVLGSTLDPTGSLDVFADQSSAGGHVFTSHLEADDFNEYDSSGSLIGTYGSGAIAVARGIAYSSYDPDGAGPEPPLDRVYVANEGSNIVEAFGAPIPGTVPDPMIETTAVSEPGTATFHGTINPREVANSYYFEWVEANEAGKSFGDPNKRLFRSPIFNLPADSLPHPVEYKATNVRGNIDWKVRLVAENTTNGLRSVSAEDTFKPPKATEAPTVTIDAPSAVEKTTAHVSGTVNPKNDSVELTVEVSEGESCSMFNSHTNENIYVPGGEVNTSIPFGYDLKKLIAGEHYCVRFTASNSFGSSVPSAIEQFDTESEPPSEVSTAFAAPRTDTAARINGRLNPEGKAEFEYQFEWSEDGLSWEPLSLHEMSVNVHEPIIVSDELKNLKPATTYYYRLGLVKNGTPPAPEPGAVKTFTTRSTAEMTLPTNALGEADRPGMELVNSPDKGNQNVFFSSVTQGVGGEVPFIAPSGNQARWAVTAGAPGSPNGAGGQFVARRLQEPTETVPNGWESRSLAPPASQQFGGGSLIYNVVAANSDQSRFIADLRAAGLASVPGSTLVRLDTHQHEEVLHTFDWPEGAEEVAGVDVSDAGAHVLTVDPENHQLVDIGAGTAEAVSIMPDGTPSECGLLSSGTGGFTSFVGGQQWRSGYHMIATTDANLVYFRAKPNGECGNPWGLYVRDRKAGETTLIDPGVADRDVEFIRATPDGRLGYFLTARQLEPADHNVGVDLYRWDQSTKESTCLTCVVPNASIALSAGGNTVSPVMVSDDFSHAYFVSHRRLVPNEGVVGGENIYVLSGGTIRFVATPSQFGITREVLNRQNARLSSDGGTLTFTSTRGGSPRLTTDPIGCGNCSQLYRYEDGEGSLECVSCAPSGATTAALDTTGDFVMSADGSTVGFVTPQALTRLDVNGATDVYQWRNGALRLITDGVSEAQTGVAAPGVRGIDADGSNMLFSVVEPALTGFEQDGLSNLYDARIGGGFAPAAATS